MYYIYLTIVNSLAGVRFGLALLTVYSSYSGDWMTTMIYLSAGTASDFYDGALARRWGVVTDRGFWLDMLSDRALLLAPILGVALRGLIPIWFFAIVFLGIIITDVYSFLRYTVSMFQMVYWWFVEGLIIVIIFHETSLTFVVVWTMIFLIISLPLLFFDEKRAKAKDWIKQFLSIVSRG